MWVFRLRKDVEFQSGKTLDANDVVWSIQGHMGEGSTPPAKPIVAQITEVKADENDTVVFVLEGGKSGVTNLVFELHTADAAFGGAVDAAVLISEAAKREGIDTEVIRAPNDGYWSDVWRVKPWCFCYWSGRPTEDWMFTTANASGVPWNDARWEHERFNEHTPQRSATNSSSQTPVFPGFDRHLAPQYTFGR